MVKNAFWKVFEATGHIGAYLLFKDYQELDRLGALENEETAKKVSSGN